jgi:hypothetical protein
MIPNIHIHLKLRLGRAEVVSAMPKSLSQSSFCGPSGIFSGLTSQFIYEFKTPRQALAQSIQPPLDIGGILFAI